MTQRSFQPGEQHPEEWRQDLNPNAKAGINHEQLGANPEQSSPTAYEIKEFHQSFPEFTNDELRRIVVLAPGSRLEQGATYVDLRTPDRREFTAQGGIVAGEGNWFIPKSVVDYPLWNRLIGVEHPERLDQADDSSAR